MLRLIGTVCIFGGTLGLGVVWQKQYVRRIEHLRSLVLMLQCFQGEIQYGRGTIPECCLAVADRMPEPLRQTLKETANRVNQEGGEKLETIFAEGIEKLLPQMSVKREDLEEAFLFAAGKSFADREQQIAMIYTAKQRLQETIAVLEREREKRCNLSVALGTLGGMLLLVVLA